MTKTTMDATNELLAALQKVTQGMKRFRDGRTHREGCPRNDNHDKQCTCGWPEARVAIAKATGDAA